MSSLRRFLLYSLPATLSLTAAAEPLRYNRDIRPLLSDNCFHCHGPDASHRKGGLRLDLRGEALRPAKSGATAIVPGKPEASELIARIHHPDPETSMPPAEAHKVLTPEQKQLLSRWIAEGAAYEAHWAYTPVIRPPVPSVTAPGAHVLNPIDAFIQEPLLRSGLSPSPEALPATLLRRLSLDLTGLPPAPDEVATFSSGFSPESFKHLLDRLLASPQYGERMAQHWLDVVRYADTVGFHGDQNHNAWAYRDWVIDAFNTNKRFDVFTAEQLAGDLLPHPDESQWTATCFNRLTMMTREGGAQPGEYLAKYTADRVRTVSMAWLGSTLGCAECHDHKFDPWSQKDFYSLGAFFADVKQWGVYNDYSYTPNPDLKGWSNDHPFPPERIVHSPALQGRMKLLEERMRKLIGEAEPALTASPERMASFTAWRETTAQFLTAHPDGWGTPQPAVHELPSAPKGKKPSPAAGTAAAKPPAFLPAEVTADQRVVFDKGGARTAEITLPATGQVSAIRLEILPDARHSGSIARTGGAVTLRPVFQKRSGDKKEPLPVMVADSPLKRPRYANGFELIGIQDGWTTKDGSAHLPHTGFYVLEDAAVFAPGESLVVSLPDHTAASVRISVSPFDRSAVHGFGVPPELTGSAEAARRWYLRSLPGEPAGRAARRLEKDYLACRGGTTPVMVTEHTAKPLTIRVLPRGNWQDETGAPCAPATPAFLPAPPSPAGTTLTRLDLARWLMAPENPLTARVIMNRLWKQFFGTGLSAQVDDLGAQGEAPSHPELLDWLAAEFRDSGWDFRHMVRLIVESHTYRQQSLPRAELRETDPLNRCLASQNPRRLEAEAVRDNALAIAGLLNLTPGGPPVKPWQPANYYEGLQFPDRVYTADTGPDQWRRGIYTHWQRTFLHPMMANFDAPSREDCIALRTTANTPQQALTLLNDPSFVEAARVWAAALLKQSPDDSARLDTAFRKALARSPSPAEKDGLLPFLTNMREEWRTRPEDAAAFLATGAAPPAEPGTDHAELAAWTSVCRVLLNLHETITRY